MDLTVLKEHIQEQKKVLANSLKAYYAYQAELATKLIKENYSGIFEAYHHGYWFPIINVEGPRNSESNCVVSLLNHEREFATVMVQIRTNLMSRIEYPVIPQQLKYIRRVSDKESILNLI